MPHAEERWAWHELFEYVMLALFHFSFLDTIMFTHLGAVVQYRKLELFVLQN